METELASNLIALGTAFCKARGLEETTVGRMCAADGRFFSRIRSGKTFTAKKYDEVVCWFDKNWPAGAAWPEAIAKPLTPERFDGLAASPSLSRASA